MFENPQIRQMNESKMFPKKKNPFRTNCSSIFPSKVQNLPVFSIKYMIRIRFFVPGELIQNGFSAAQYLAVTPSVAKSTGLQAIKTLGLVEAARDAQE